MNDAHASTLRRLIGRCRGEACADQLAATLAIDPALLTSRGDVTAAEMAMALNVVLFDDLLQRAPSAAAYVAGVRARGERVIFDHGALRTVRLAGQDTGQLPPGQSAFARILAPLGYQPAATYPLPALGMTGHAWRHMEAPETIPQFFVSELHVERFSPAFQAAAARVFGRTRDPLDAFACEALDAFASGARVPLDVAAAVLPRLAAVFGCHHDPCQLQDYRTLLAESAEAAWIATEGNAFNHATDRVPDVEALAEQLRAEGRPIKDQVEVSASGRVRQTAFRADLVTRRFRDGERLVTRQVPGSFYEFISRQIDPATGQLDLAFDSSNAQGIFAMTQAA